MAVTKAASDGSSMKTNTLTIVCMAAQSRLTSSVVLASSNTVHTSTTISRKPGASKLNAVAPSSGSIEKGTRLCGAGCKTASDIGRVDIVATMSGNRYPETRY